MGIVTGFAGVCSERSSESGLRELSGDPRQGGETQSHDRWKGGWVSSLPGKESKQEAAWLGRCLETVQAGRCPHTVRHIKGDGDPEVTM